MTDPKVRSSPLMARRQMLIGGVLAASSALAYARQPRPYARRVPREKFDAWVPRTVDTWSVSGTDGVLLPPPDALSDRLYDNLVTRTYQGADVAPVMMLLAYNNLQDGVVQLHRPEICYPVGGFELSNTEEVPIAVPNRTIPASFFSARAPDRVEQVLYFTRLGKMYPRRWVEQRWAVVQTNLAGHIPDGLLVRFSMLGQDRQRAVDTLSRFAADFIAASPPALRNLLVV